MQKKLQQQQIIDQNDRIESVESSNRMGIIVSIHCTELCVWSKEYERMKCMKTSYLTKNPDTQRPETFKQRVKLKGITFFIVL